MSKFTILVRVTRATPGEFHAIASAVASLADHAQVRRDVVATDEEARERADYLAGLLATALRAQGHQFEPVIGDAYSSLDSTSRT